MVVRVGTRGIVDLGRASPGASATAFVQHATRHGVSVASGREFCPNDVDCPNIRLPYTAAPDVLDEGMRRLAIAWQTFDRAPVEACII